MGWMDGWTGAVWGSASSLTSLPPFVYVLYLFVYLFPLRDRSLGRGLTD